MQRAAHCFKTTLHRLFVLNAAEKDLKRDENQLWSVLLTSSILHDVGKLTDQYVSRGTAQTYTAHHQVSAVITKKVLSKAFDDYTALEVAYSVLFHHEAIDWKAVERKLSSSYIQEALPSTRGLTYTVNQNRLDAFERNLRKILDQIYQGRIVTQQQHQTLTQTLIYAVRELAANQRKTLQMDQELNVRRVQSPRYLVPALALYRLLYLADNRAASARSYYWLKSIRQVNWYCLENVAKQIHQLLPRDYYVGLSAIPGGALQGSREGS
ncbi:MAG: HD domain-containing protein [Candidatus Nezhaarchaeales archaeon]